MQVSIKMLELVTLEFCTGLSDEYVWQANITYVGD
jgi:hypothetical protein